VLQLDPRRIALFIAVSVPTLTLATATVGILQDGFGIPNASAVYLVAVVATAYAVGAVGAILVAVASALVYNFLFTEPRYTLTVHAPEVWLSVVLLLFVGIVVGQLAALQRARAQVALLRERQAHALFRVSRALATRGSTLAVLPEVAAILRDESRMGRVWITLGADDATERIVADTGTAGRPPAGGLVRTLRRTPGEEPAEWIRLHQPSAARGRGGGPEAFRVRVEAGARPLGSVWAHRDRSTLPPDRTETRLLSAAADQIGQALESDRLADESRAAEIARGSDALKSALLQSVSHDLRTPLAAIRAAAGTLRPESQLTAEERNDSADTIEREVEYLNRLVTNLLDLSRIEAGALRPDRDVYDLEEVISPTIQRLRSRLGERPLEVDLPAELVLVDPVLLDEALTNVLENAIKYTPADAKLRIGASRRPEAPLVRLSIEDAGPGVPPEAMRRLFEKFYRVPGTARTSRQGTGVGLAVVRGLLEAMGGQASARRSELGGLAIDLDLVAAPTPTPAPPARPGPAPGAT
jgi:two-component system sensor histidine kinase KdpD